MKNRTVFEIVGCLVLGAILGGILSMVSRAQTPATLQLTGTQSHTACTLSTTGSATFCFATDGLWQSLNGGAYTQIGASAGVTSIAVNGGAAQTGAVALTIPTKATTTVTSTASTTIQ
jgi:hypothetical protein